MNGFTFSVPQSIIVGRKSLQKLGRTAKALGATSAFLISDPQLEKIGIVQDCISILANDGIAADSFTETEKNPSVETVDRATARFKASGADCIVALGGGSPMDVAKAVGVLARYGGSITQYEGAGKVPGPIVPLIAIPTTAGTGSETTAFSVITDHSRDYKLTVFSERIIPARAILDADLIATVPAPTAAACGMDALIHAMEAYLSRAASPFTDAMAEKAMALIGKNLRRYVANRQDTEAAEAMLVGSMLAGIAFAWARLGDVHAMSHPVSAYYDVPHGVANAILLPAVVDFNALADCGKYRNIYGWITEAPVPPDQFRPAMLGDELRALNAALGIPATLGEVGVTGEHLDAMADDAMKSGNIAVNPRATTKQDILRLYRQVLGSGAL
ncbi:MAG: iron-containing alcohol dehydrogenase family protein [Aristaeellaceae bacterium]